MCKKKAWQAWNDSLLSWLFRILLFPGKPGILHPKSPEKPRNPGRNGPCFPGFPLCAKKRGKPGMISSFPGFSGFCAFLESPEFYTPKAWKSQESQEKMVHAFLAFPYVQKSAETTWNDSLLSWLFRILRFRGKPRILHPKSLEKPRKPGRNWSTLSWLSAMCKKPHFELVSWNLSIQLNKLNKSPQNPGKPGITFHFPSCATKNFYYPHLLGEPGLCGSMKFVWSCSSNPGK